MTIVMIIMMLLYFLLTEICFFKDCLEDASGYPNNQRQDNRVHMSSIFARLVSEAEAKPKLNQLFLVLLYSPLYPSLHLHWKPP